MCLHTRKISIPLFPFMEQKEIHPGFQEIRLWVIVYKRMKVPPNRTTGFVSFMSIKVINPLATTEGRSRQMMDLYNPPCHFQELILKKLEHVGKDTRV